MRGLRILDFDMGLNERFPDRLEAETEAVFESISVFVPLLLRSVSAAAGVRTIVLAAARAATASLGASQSEYQAGPAFLRHNSSDARRA
jgi:hypothetical protein